MPEDEGLQATITAMTRELKPNLVVALENSRANYAVPEADFAKVDEYAETIPTVVDEVVLQVVPDVIERVAVRLSEHLSIEETNGISDYFETPSGVALLGSMAKIRDGNLEEIDEASAVADAMTGMSKDQMRDFIAFTQSPAGQAFVREKATIEVVFAEEFSDAVQAPLNLRIRRDLCTQVSRAYC